jgi:hypothetical protein
MLPIARALKRWSVVLNWTGRVGPVPEGMSALVALRAKRLAERHAAIKAGLLQAAARFERERGYRAPYWEWVRLARQASRETGG